MLQVLSDGRTDDWPVVHGNGCDQLFITPKSLPVLDTLPAAILPGDCLEPLDGLQTGTLVAAPFKAHPLYPHHQNIRLARYSPSTMTKKRRSLQSIVLPSFLQSPQFMTYRKSPTRSRSYSYVDRAPYACPFDDSEAHSTMDDPPPFLLDADPFANLTSSAVITPLSSSDRRPPTTSPVLQSFDTTLLTLNVPRSPLSPPNSAQSSYFGSVSPQLPAALSPRVRSLGRVKPAYERPAFSPRPSLPSLGTLAHMSIAPPDKARKGRVGAGLPYEPWEDVDSDEEGTETPCPTRPSSPLGAGTEADADVGCDRLSNVASAFGSPHRDTFTFYDNISTPSLELSSASLSRSLSLESMSPSEYSLGDDQDDQFRSFFPQRTIAGDHDIDHPPADVTASLLPSLSRLDADRGDKLGYDPSIHAPSVHAPHLPTITELPLELQLSPSTDPDTSMTAHVPSDSTGWSSSQTYSSGAYGGTSSSGGGGDGRGGYSSRGYHGFPPSGNDGGWAAGGGRGDDGDEGRRRPTHRSALSSSSTSRSSSSEDESEEDYSQPISRSNGREGVTDSEDDVPLAQRIPTALEAQRSIRQKYREERDKRRRERALKAGRVDDMTASSPQLPSALSSSQEAAIQASKQLQSRPRTRTLPNSAPKFTPEDLARKLQDVQVGEESQLRRLPSSGRNAEPTRGRTRTVDELHRPQPVSSSPTPDPAFRVLRPMRSFHRPASRGEEAHAQVRPSTAEPTSKLGRALSRARSRVRGEETVPPSAWQAPPIPIVTRRSLENSPPVPPLPQPRPSGEGPRKLSKGVFSAKTSIDLDRSPKLSTQIPPTPVAINIKTQQRIFIGDMQRFNVVEIDNDTHADDVVAMIRNQGSLNGLTGLGDWMLFEVAQDFGMERPIRGYELLSDVQASWNKDKLVNMFVLKLTPLAAHLRREAVPSSSPTHGSYVEWESKRGKWSKRWLRLREHGLWLSKRDNGKDEVFLCSLSSFDAYFVTRAYKAPKPFVFAVKSTDNLTLFENTADYLHVFSCQPHEGKKWIEKILIARSYVLHQERHVLFNPRASSGNAAGTAVSLSRAGTRKRPVQPLVSISAADVFEPGSLLSKS
ncbi:hypothetical protein APHAL10511_002765 [Amanita phalloides]|nr:hypothetical protein APHAL10511_002765 [Amanita phalloides]